MSNILRHITLPWFATFVGFVMLILVNLSGASQSLLFLQQLYLSEVLMSRDYFWTLYNFCSKTSAGVISCTPNFSAYPYLPYELSNQIRTSRVYFYGLRAAYGLFIAAVASAFLANVMAVVSLFWKRSRPYTWFRWTMWLAYVTAAVAAALETSLHTSGRNAFQSLGYTARLGVRMMVFMWVAVGFLFLACLFLCYSTPPIFADTYKNGRYDEPVNAPPMMYAPPAQPQGYQSRPYQQGYQPQGYPPQGYNQQTVTDEGNGYQQYPYQRY